MRETRDARKTLIVCIRMPLVEMDPELYYQFYQSLDEPISDDELLAGLIEANSTATVDELLYGAKWSLERSGGT